MTFLRQAGHDEETIKETLAQNDLQNYYEPPVEEPDIEDKNSYIWSEENGAWMLWNDETEKWEII